MKILIISHYNPQVFEYGGLATFVRNLSSGLRELGHEVYFLSTSSSAYRKDSNVVKVVPTAFHPKDIDSNVYRVIEYCLDTDGFYDTIIANDYFSPCITRKSKLIAYIHNFVSSIWEFILFAYSDKIYTNSNMNKSIIEPHFKYVRTVTTSWTNKEPSKDVVVLHPPPPQPPEKIVKPNNNDLEELEEPILCYVGRMQDYKNFNMFRKLVIDLRVNALVISHDTPNIVEVFEYGGRNSKIMYFGEVPEELKWGIMKYCTLGVYPSLFDPYGLVPLEFVISKVPVVVSKNCGVTEVLKTVTFDPYNYNELVNVVKDVLKRRDEYLNELLDSPIIRTSWREFAKTLINV